ncbi:MULTISPECIES: biotin--[acetyl-CoA-carboxylase] ligase [unclassified Oceanobacter]|jgi:BirA family biotin operon repressor/biotin-[acetyl-CoA-carboxylase] ligase|uniref:biotin--[acetyl-CoA-carboxylase] ligase n=1 Tax=unclassified Oceanobacter TaxID=2620260 RepID=UPI0026E3AC83|nr:MULTISPECIES: biotin--[acetyl-CoA-carboxylase] ligase [unclassified Oceanobacter]MDO6682740.1 biotin--[acetyl-CoA-carboxylase] ligase [Oceanobacter sp. 5_MG-2023]MDP2549112.1 biotin--[acetyl-CoA-carboxylase] ligase [Oceanobacter sp. 4_MG-2023]MDP2609022.1 biotin--[acetyl-CoA-carboxylase] ligase [Oceanobacter sp. 1_MG-2023]MDP2612344.1 biotin--[acetyl-CoA-carboxylase] ligase [Oceanobacter sp. 2_MG-2023]
MLSQLLALLSDGRFHSGDDLGQILGVSRAAIWKQMKKLDELDIPYSSVKGKGYRLQDAIELLDQASIEQQMSDRLDRLDILLDVDSTNSWLYQRAPDHLGKRYAVLAEKQHQGRGRRGRHWVSPFGKNIYLSFLVTLPGTLAEQEGLSLMVAIALEKALLALGIEGAGLKWPNDVYIEDKKVAGILLEGCQTQPGFCQIVIGIGLNLALNPQDAERIEQPWTALRHYQPGLSRNTVAAVLLQQLNWAVDEFQRDGFGPWMAYWAERDVFYRKEVVLSGLAEPRYGVVKGVNRKGELLLQTTRGIEVVIAGELSVRPVN